MVAAVIPVRSDVVADLAQRVAHVSQSYRPRLLVGEGRRHVCVPKYRKSTQGRAAEQPHWSAQFWCYCSSCSSRCVVSWHAGRGLIVAVAARNHALYWQPCARAWGWGCVGPHAQSSQYVTIPAAGGCGRRHEGCAGCMVRAAIPYPAAWVVCHIMVRLQPQVAHGMHKGTTFTLSCPALCQHSCCSAAAIMLLSCSVLYSVSTLVALSQHACYCCCALACTLSARSLLCPARMLISMPSCIVMGFPAPPCAPLLQL